jgi:hypothetical protein
MSVAFSWVFASYLHSNIFRIGNLWDNLEGSQFVSSFEKGASCEVICVIVRTGPNSKILLAQPFPRCCFRPIWKLVDGLAICAHVSIFALAAALHDAMLNSPGGECHNLVGWQTPGKWSNQQDNYFAAMQWGTFVTCPSFIFWRWSMISLIYHCSWLWRQLVGGYRRW